MNNWLVNPLTLYLNEIKDKLQFKSLYEMFQNALNRHWLAYILPMVFFAFMFHFYVSTYWLSILLKAETYDFYVSLLVSMFHSKNTEGEKQKHCGSDSKPLWERFKNTVGAWKRSLSVLKSETWNLKWNIEVVCFIFLNDWYSITLW